MAWWRLARAPPPLVAALIRRDLSRPSTSREDVRTPSLADVVEVARHTHSRIRMFSFTVNVAVAEASVYDPIQDIADKCWVNLLPENTLAVIVKEKRCDMIVETWGNIVWYHINFLREKKSWISYGMRHYCPPFLYGIRPVDFLLCNT
jgi:hypothetical protein